MQSVDSNGIRHDQELLTTFDKLTIHFIQTDVTHSPTGYHAYQSTKSPLVGVHPVYISLKCPAIWHYFRTTYFGLLPIQMEESIQMTEITAKDIEEERIEDSSVLAQDTVALHDTVQRLVIMTERQFVSCQGSHLAVANAMEDTHNAHIQLSQTIPRGINMYGVLAASAAGTLVALPLGILTGHAAVLMPIGMVTGAVIGWSKSKTP